jgi:hypothetical protein
MTVNCLDHSHDLATNPLSFPRHRHSLDEYQALIRTARKHREVIISYLDSRRVLEAKGSGLTLIIREFYNTVRDLAPDKDKPDTIDGLLVALHEAGFIYRTRVKIEEDEEGNPVKKQMI